MKKKSGWRGWSIFENNPFIEGFAEWMDSSDGELFDEVRELTWQSLKNVDVDASARKLIWEDGKRLSIDESVQRIHADYPEFPLIIGGFNNRYKERAEVWVRYILCNSHVPYFIFCVTYLCIYLLTCLLSNCN